MKKVMCKTLTLLLSVVLAVCAFSACGLITTNKDRNMAQIVASVKIDDNIDADEIKKSDLVSGFMSYGYYYVSQYGYTTSKAYKLILDNLVKNRIVVQKSRTELADLYNAMLDGGASDTEFLKYFKANAAAKDAKLVSAKGDADTLSKYLTPYELAKAAYNVKVSVNGLIDSYESEDDSSSSEETEDVTFTARTTPTVADTEERKEYELVTAEPTDYEYKVADVVLKKGWETLKADEKYDTVYKLNVAVYEAYKIDVSTTARRKGLNKVIKALKNNGLIKSDENYDFNKEDKINEVLNYSYFKDALKSQYESLIVYKYEDSLVSDVEAKLTDEALWEQYVTEYNTQKANYQNDSSAYETALGNVSDKSFVVCNLFNGYGYVSNLLIGFTTEQTAEYDAYAARKDVTNEQIKQFRNELLKELLAKDQRETWVYSSYGQYDEQNGKFTFEDKYLVSEKDSAAYNKLNVYNGTVAGATSKTSENSDKVEETKWSFENVFPNSMTFDKFLTDYVNPLTGIEKKIYDANNEAATVAKIGAYDKTVRSAFDDLVYAYSTDTGILGKYYGYTYSPYTSAKTYVEEFAAAAKKVVSEGEGSYTIVGTKFGYHIILCTAVVGADPYDVNNDAGKAVFLNDLKTEETLAYKYRKVKLDLVTDDEIEKLANNMISTYLENNVTYYENTYGDLITSEDSSS